MDVISSSSVVPSSSTVLFDFVLLFEHILSLCAKFGSVSLMSALLYIAHFRKGKLRVDSLSPCMHLYLVAQTLCSAMGIPYVFYMLFWALPHIWSGLHDNPYYSPYVLFWTGIIEISYITAAPCLVTLLALERCLILKTVSNCKTTSCETIRTLSIHSVAPKVVVGLINIVCCFGFLLMLRSFGMPANLKNRVVKMAIFTEIFFNTLPALGALLFNWSTGLVMANYVGELSISACPVDAFICAVIYWRNLVKRGGVAQQQQNNINLMTLAKPMTTMANRNVDRRQTIR
ncbi:hypothetical protein niasHT_012974 [Heterodera trifolii]|uniref:Uncharacterized protein n=1 Tax=Heterodera trifolii TaxID=157864 RepID=A0ABD2L3H3_9BILA